MFTFFHCSKIATADAGQLVGTAPRAVRCGFAEITLAAAFAFPMAFASISSAASTPEPLTIAVDGRPAAEIVVSDGCHSAELFAADDLAHWVETITGARLPVVTNAPTAAPGAKIRIGAAFGAAAFPDDARKIGATDGFAIRRRGDDLYLFGTKPRASVYAVATLLEENTDIIWARPSEDFETVFTPPEGAVWVRVWIYDGTLEYVRITDGAMYL
jgi:hypothetical protein